MKKKSICIGILTILMLVGMNFSTAETIKNIPVEKTSNFSIIYNESEYTLHDPFTILYDAGFNLPFIKGSGTSSDPYIIEGLLIKERAKRNGFMIGLLGTNKHVIIKNNLFFLNDNNHNVYDEIGIHSSKNVRIENNIFIGPEIGITLSESSNIIIKNNYFNINERIFMFRQESILKNIEISDNILTDHINLYGVEQCLIKNNLLFDRIILNEITNLQILHNVILSSPSQGIDSDTIFGDVKIKSNLIKNSISSGIKIYSCSTDNMIIKNNSLISNGFAGILSSYSNPKINFNNIVGNGYLEDFHTNGVCIYNHGDIDYIDARNNWWGSVDGPSGEGSGSGDGVDEDILFDPWLSSPVNIVPCKPWKLFFYNNIKAGQEYEYKFVAYDPNDEPIKYKINWGDGSPIFTSNFYPSSEKVSFKKTFDSKGDYLIKVKVIDEFGKESETLEIGAPVKKSKSTITPFTNLLLKLIEDFPFLQRLLNL